MTAQLAGHSPQHPPRAGAVSGDARAPAGGGPRLLAAAAAFALGVAGGAWAPWPRSVAALWYLPLVASLLMLAAAALPAFRYRSRPRRCPARARQVAALLGIALAGTSWCLLHAGPLFGPELPPALERQDLRVEGRILALPEPAARGTRLLFAPEAPLADGTPLPARLRLTWFAAPQALEAGSRWRLTVRLKRSHGLVNPAGFDYERWLFAQGIAATGYVRAEPLPEPLEAGGGWVRVRQRIGGAIDRALGDSPSAGLVKALAIGDRSGLSNHDWAVTRATGTSHLLAISGLHIAMLGLGAFAAMRWLWSRLGSAPLLVPAPTAGACAALLVAAGYAALAGFSVPTQRALLMFTVLMAALGSGRSGVLGRGLAWALLGVLLLDPLAVLSGGFWLSFGAVAALLWGFAGRQGRARRALGGLLRAQWVAWVGLAPLTLLLFDALPLASLPANALAIPLVTWLVVPLVLAGTLLLALPWLGTAILKLAAGVLGALWQGLEALARFAEPLAMPQTMAGPAFACALLGVAWLLAPRGVPARWLGMVLLLPALVARPQAPPQGEVELAVLDVGQGLAAVVQTARHTLVYDTGPWFSDRFNGASAALLPWLASRGVRELDRVMVSHADSDHAGALGELLAAFPRAEVWSGTPRQLELPSGAARPCRAGQRWRWDGVDFAVLAPQRAGGDDRNAASCVLRVSAGSRRLLLTGDIEAAGERRLAVRLARLDRSLEAEVLVAPHHGSVGASSPALVAAVQPRHVIFSAGYRNRYGHPHSAVLQRWASAGARLWRTDCDGALRVWSEAGGGLRVQARRAMRPALWRAGCGGAPAAP